MIYRLPLLLIALASPLHAAAENWWNPAWAWRQPLALDTGASGAALAADPGTSTLLVRLHDGNFQFGSAAADGADLRFVAADGKTVLAHRVERWDALLNEAFVWVKVPEPKAGEKSTLHLYYGSSDPAKAPAAPAAETYDTDTALVYHFAESGVAPVDSSAGGLAATGEAATFDGAIIGRGLRLQGLAPLVIPAAPQLAWQAGQGFTFSAWIRPAALQAGAILLDRAEGASRFRVIVDQGSPAVEIDGRRSPAGAPVAAGTWHHLAVAADTTGIVLYLDGAEYGRLAGPVPALATPIHIGNLPDAPAGTVAFTGELDELQFSKVARSAAWIKLAAASQGPDAARILAAGTPESSAGPEEGGHSAALEHVMLFGDIAKNMMFDGWIAIGVCVVMIAVGWSVALGKFFYLNSISKGSEIFLRQWKSLSSDLTALDHGDEDSIRTLGGKVDARTQAIVKKSPLYQIYHIGSEEIRHRLARDKERTKGLSGRSIQAIRAALDGGLVRAQHKLTNGLVYLTISIAGGPYVGLLGTVVGVMITFAIIAKSGEVDVNSIAPGIASALLATVAGLVVAIPALFIYSYLNSRIKNTTAEIQVFIDEFVAKMAEFYPPAGENSPHAPQSIIARDA